MSDNQHKWNIPMTPDTAEWVSDAIGMMLQAGNGPINDEDDKALRELRVYIEDLSKAEIVGEQLAKSTAHLDPEEQISTWKTLVQANRHLYQTQGFRDFSKRNIRYMMAQFREENLKD